MRKQLRTTGFPVSNCGYFRRQSRTAADTWGRSVWDKNIRLCLHRARPTQAWTEMTKIRVYVYAGKILNLAVTESTQSKRAPNLAG